MRLNKTLIEQKKIGLIPFGRAQTVEIVLVML